MTEQQGASPTVSVVMPTYNRAHLLPPVVDSILSQDFQDLELVIVDDGSTDNTGEVVREIQARDPRVRYVPLPENRGCYFARNVGLHHATGKYIAPAESDDPWTPARLQMQVDLLEKYPQIDILFGNFLNVDHIKGTQGLGFDPDATTAKGLVLQRLEEGLFLVKRGLEVALLRSNFIAVPTVLMRREVFSKVGVYCSSLRGPGDLEFWLRAAIRGASFAYLDRCLLIRNRLPDSLSAQGVTYWMQRLEGLEVMRQVCVGEGRYDLLPHVRATEVRTYCNLLRIYGERGERGRVLWAYSQSLRRGVSLRATKWFVLALLGPRVLAWVVRLKRQR